MSGRRDSDMERWITETQMFQRIAGTPESPRSELEADWRAMRRKFPRLTLRSIAENAATQVIIAKVAKGEIK